MVNEGLLTPAQGLARLDGIDLETVVRTSFAAACPGHRSRWLRWRAWGWPAARSRWTPHAVKRLTAAGTPAILVRRETVTADIEGMALAAGILTASAAGPRTRRWWRASLERCAWWPARTLEIDLDHRQCRIGGTLLNEGDFLSLDGNIGAVYPGRLTPVTERPDAALAIVVGWQQAAAA